MWDFRSGRGKKTGSGNQGMNGGSGSDSGLPILRQGHAHRMVFFYPGEEGTYVENVEVTLFVNGIVHFKSANEESTTHLQNCEILWTSEPTAIEDRSAKVRLLKPGSPRSEFEGQFGKDSPSGRSSKPHAQDDSSEDDF
jgi:hypothetical protein